MDALILKILYSILVIPVIAVVVYSIKEPRDSFLFGRRWMYKNDELEPIEEIIKFNRNTSIVALVSIILLSIYIIFSWLLKRRALQIAPHPRY